jgi:hypothetical protein
MGQVPSDGVAPSSRLHARSPIASGGRALLTARVSYSIECLGSADFRIRIISPWQNGFAERLIGSIRRECVHHIIVLGEAHLVAF